MAYTEVVKRRRVPFLPTVVVGLATSVIGVLANAGANYAVGWTGLAAWLAVPAAAVLAGLVTTVATAHVEARMEDPAGGQPPAAFTGVSIPVATLFVLLVLGVGGYFAAVGAKAAVEWFTGNEPGQQRLVQPVRGESQGLVLNVTGVEETRHFTRVELSGRNHTSNTLTLPVFGNVTFTGRDGTTLEADPRRSDWTGSLAPGALQNGVLVFAGELPAGVRRASISFATVFPSGGFEGPRTIRVTGLRLAPRS